MGTHKTTFHLMMKAGMLPENIPSIYTENKRLFAIGIGNFLTKKLSLFPKYGIRHKSALFKMIINKYPRIFIK